MSSQQAACQIFRSRDAELLAQAAQLPLAVIGSMSCTARDIRKLSLGAGCSIEGETPKVPIHEIAELVRRLAEPVPCAEHSASVFGDGSEAVDKFGRSLVWVRSKRTLVAGWRATAGTSSFVAAISGSERGLFPRWQRELIRLALMQETERSQGARDSGEILEGGKTLKSVLDHLALPISLAERSGKTVYCNIAAREHFKTSDVLTLAEGRLHSVDVDLHERLHLAIRGATGGNQRLPSMLILPRRAGEKSFAQGAVFISSVPNEPCLALVVCTPGLQDEAQVKLMLSKLGLSPAEQRLTRHLVSGARLEDAAKGMALKISTVRSYVRNIFDKTGTSRQSELVALIHSLLPPIMPVEPRAVSPKTMTYGAATLQTHDRRQKMIVATGSVDSVDTPALAAS